MRIIYETLYGSMVVFSNRQFIKRSNKAAGLFIAGQSFTRSNMEIQVNAITWKGKPLTLLGPKVKVGDAAPDFACVSPTLDVVRLSTTPAKARMFSVVPSLDTPVCSI